MIEPVSYYKRKTKKMYYAVVDVGTGEIVGVDTMIELAKQFNCSRHTINATFKGKMLLRGIYSVRIATDEEVTSTHKNIHYIDGKLENVKNVEVVNDPFDEKGKPHEPMPYRSSSARRFTPL